MALIDKLTAIGDAIRAKTGGTELLTLDAMPNEIASIETGGGGEVEPIVLTGKQEKTCSGVLASAYIKSFGDTISTYDLINADSMFEGFTGERIPFDINFKANNSSDVASNFFLNCKNLKELPKINNLYVYNHLQCFFSNCWSLREIPEDYFNSWVYSPSMSSFIRHNAIFNYCYSLRSMPLNWLKNLQANSANTSSYYYEGFPYCYVLDELINMPIPYTANWTSNAFTNTFVYCHRLKNITFETNDDGSPKVVNWKSQTIDLTSQVGYCDTDKNRFLNYNSGIIADKEVKDDTTYQALKNDPDWFSTSGKYSRYNHDSAVATINSLPDASAYLAANGGTNTIKFKGFCGSATDGGAINTLTEEEIAVAAAKGWTVSFA